MEYLIILKTMYLYHAEYIFYIIIQDLQKREEILAKKEAMLDEKNELEMKKLRSSQVISKVKES